MQYSNHIEIARKLLEQQKEINKLQAENARLREALRFWTQWTNRDKQYLIEQYGSAILDDIQKAKELLA